MESITITPGRTLAAVASTCSTQVSLRHSRRSASSPSRSARMAICCRDSSPDTYRQRFVAPSAATACSNSVDLPMPGSPPNSTTEPGTSPPPSTRSSSASPVGSRATSPAATADRRVTAAGAWPVWPRRLVAGLAGTRNSSMVFHARQSGHCPAHLGCVLPQALHW